MATSLYEYNKFDTLLKVADMYNTDVKTIVRLNPWLKDPVDGHTYMKPSKAKTKQTYDENYLKNQLNSLVFQLKVLPVKNTTVVYLTKTNGKTVTCKEEEDGFYPQGIVSRIDYNKSTIVFQSLQDVTNLTISYIPSTVLPVIVVPLISNGNTSVEEYWNTLSETAGIDFSTLLENFMLGYEDLSIDDINNLKVSVDNYNSATSDSLIDTFGLNRLSTDFMDAKVKTIMLYTLNNIAANVHNYTYSSTVNLYDGKKHGVNVDAYNKNILKLFNNKIGLDGIPVRDFNSFEINQGNFHIGNMSNSLKLSDGKSIGNPLKGKCIVTIGNSKLEMPCYPESVQDGIDADYSTQTILGRSEPFQVYNNSGPRSISFKFEMHREMLRDSNSESSIDSLVRIIESGVYPQYTSGAVAPQKVTVTVGTKLYISGVMTSERTEWYGPIDEKGDYKQVSVSFTVVEVTGNPKSASYISKYGGNHKSNDTYK